MRKILAFASWILAVFAAAPGAQPVSETSSNRLSFVVDGNVLSIPYYRNSSISGTYPLVERAAILVHGTNRNAANAYDNLLAAAAVTGVLDGTALLAAPHFLIEEDVAFSA